MNFFNDKPKEEIIEAVEPKFEIVNDAPKTNPFVVETPQPETQIVEPVVIKRKVDTVEKKSGIKYNQTNILDLINIKQSYGDGKVKVFDDFNLQIKDITDKGQFISILGQSGCGKCFTKDSLITIKNKKTGKIEKIESFELIKRLRQPV